MAEPGRGCARCGGVLRPSHTTYAGAGRSLLVLRCAGCGAEERGAARAAGEVEERRVRELRARRERQAGAGRPPGRGSGRRELAEGPPANPVLDEETARRLRELLGE